jgi:hypothetical protein
MGGRNFVSLNSAVIVITSDSQDNAKAHRWVNLFIDESESSGS